jgi:hypothetical protein
VILNGGTWKGTVRKTFEVGLLSQHIPEEAEEINKKAQS